MRRYFLLFVFLLASAANAQTLRVFEGELQLFVELEAPVEEPYVGEMVLVTIKGVYRRHITRETLQQPKLEGFSWAQLGPDNWSETRLNGQKVKVFERRMALYPNRPGRLVIDGFRHRLTLTDEGDNWFDHEIRSEPISLEVRDYPRPQDWWLPVNGLRISDDWSNAPDRLADGEGVLRVIRIEAHGATPEMLPPMPELRAPSAMVFAHPEKRFIERNPNGPVSYAFWRWTIRPTNNVSAILEPIEVSYFDTKTRQAERAIISAQRIAYLSQGNVEPVQNVVEPPGGFELRHATILSLIALTMSFVLFVGRISWRVMPAYLGSIDGMLCRLVWAALRKDVRAMRRAIADHTQQNGPSRGRRQALDELDTVIFSRAPSQTTTLWPFVWLAYQTQKAREKEI